MRESQILSERLTTIRKEIIELLKSKELTVKDLSQVMGIPEKEIASHLEHIKKSLNKSGYEIDVVPASCTKCGFRFKKRESMKKPSRCPLCKSENVKSQVLRILKKRV